ncbi:TonB-dependent receptor [Pelobium sp.]|nr:TonB-dependent receptor plug domain-containing protein [Pelobium sp.]MDA9554982.1 TonB-dependent receptor [Pelobium sp.]
MNTKNYHRERLLWSKLYYKKLLIGLVFLFIELFHAHVFAQQAIAIKVKNQSLNKVITSLRDNYDVKLSFNDDKLSQYTVSLDKTFNSSEEAIRYLLKGFPLTLENINGVFIISSKRENLSNKKYLLTGHVSDGISQESLPFSSITINDYPLTTDLKGNFSYSSVDDSVFNLQVSYLGYYKLDTLVTANNNLQIPLFQNSIKIEEVVLTSRSAEKATNTNYSAGYLKLNRNVGEYLPGSSDNSVYNLLRLQPGVLASGEQANDLIIWGSYRGQTKVSFDGFTIFGLKNFNDNIGAINPLMAKDITVKKGGYGAEQGDRVGGIIDITGIEGNAYKPTVNIGVNNLTMNASASTPLFKNTSLVLAGRQTYYNLYNAYTSSTLTNNRNGVRDIVDLSIKPDYIFKDVNLKFSGRTIQGDNYYLSLFSGNDKLNSSYSTQQDRLNINGANDEKHTQYGASAFYNKIWKNGAISSFTVASSGLNSNNVEDLIVKQRLNGRVVRNTSDKTINTIDERSIKFTHKLPSNQKFNLFTGFGYIQNKTTLDQDSLNIKLYNDEHYSNRLFSFIESPYFFTPNFKITPGLRGDFDLGLQQLFIQPRLSSSYRFSDNFRMTASWGLFRQFIAYTAVMDDEGNYQYQWTVSDGKKIPIYKSQHWVLDAAYERNKFWINTDIYYKYTTGVTKFIQNTQGRSTIFGDGRSYGIDLLIKKEFKSNYAWIGYSLSRTQERFPKKTKTGVVNVYERAPQDQRHELKFAGLINLSPFYLSANYVYGSGFRSTNPLDDPSVNQLAYSRFDTALTYKFKARKYSLQCGVSILNLFNTQNLKVGNFERVPTEQLNTLGVYSQAVPFTPTVFLSFSI